MHYIPYNADVTKAEIRTGSTAGITASFLVANYANPFGDPTSSTRTISTIHGATHGNSTTTISSSSITTDSYLYMNIDGISSGVTLLQGFLTYERKQDSP